MTDHFKDKQDQTSSGLKSFKEQILADLAEGNRLRREQEASSLSSLSSHDLPITDEVTQAVDSLTNVTPELTEVENVDLTEGQAVYVKKPVPTYSEFAEQETEADLFEAEEDLSVTKVLSGFDRLFAGGDLAREQVEEPVTESVEQERQAEAAWELAVDFSPLEEKQPSTSVKEPNLFLDLVASQDLSPDGGTPLLEEELVAKAITSQDVMKGLDDEEVLARTSRQRNHRVARKISLGLLGFLTILLLATGFFAYRYVDSAIKPLDASDNTYIQVEIPSGSGNKLIGQILEESGVIKSGRIFNFYTKFKNYTNFQSGYYNFQKSMSLDDISKKLQEGGSAEPERPVAGKILIPEGYTLEQIAKAVELNANTADKTDKTPYSADKFMALVQDQAFIAKMVDKYPSLLGSLPDANSVRYQLEGYLFPATYNYYEETSLEDLVDKMLETMDLTLAPYYTQMAASGLDVNQVLTLASLVEKEGATDDDRKLIAGVFYNRWNQGMPLQSNIAILYAMGKLGEATTLREDAGIDTAIDSPFNIYVNPGLMPGPVDSPSLSAIKATVDPTDSDYLYFVADVTTGAVYYAEDFDTHNANVEKYINSHL